MNAAKLTIRLSAAQFQMLRSLAEKRSIPRYRMLAKIIDGGFAATLGGTESRSDLSEITNELAAQSVRMNEQERMLDRALFTTCAAYCYARCAASGQRKSDEVITAEITAAYERQRRLSREARS